MATFNDTLRGCQERIQAEQNTISVVAKNTISWFQREVNRLTLRAQTAERELHLVKEERNSLKEERDSWKEKFAALSLRESDKSSPTSSTSGNELVQRFSSVGPLRRTSISSRSSRFSWATSLFHGQPRCKSAEPCVPSRGNNDYFDVTIVDYPMPFRSTSAGKCAEPELIRDASRPNEGPRPCRLPYRPGEIDIHHIDVLYIPLNGRLFCRACQ